MGKLYFRYGAMGSSKTANALMVRYNYIEKGQNCILLKPGIEDRDGEKTVKSRMGLSAECTFVEDFLDEVHIDNKINGVITRETKYRYQLISSHSARRSFATINTLRNIPRNKILRATGHSSEKAFTRYICYDDDN